MDKIAMYKEAIYKRAEEKFDNLTEREKELIRKTDPVLLREIDKTIDKVFHFDNQATSAAIGGALGGFAGHQGQEALLSKKKFLPRYTLGTAGAILGGGLGLSIYNRLSKNRYGHLKNKYEGPTVEESINERMKLVSLAKKLKEEKKGKVHKITFDPKLNIPEEIERSINRR